MAACLPRCQLGPKLSPATPPRPSQRAATAQTWPVPPPGPTPHFCRVTVATLFRKPILSSPNTRTHCIMAATGSTLGSPRSGLKSEVSFFPSPWPASRCNGETRGRPAQHLPGAPPPMRGLFPLPSICSRGTTALQSPYLNSSPPNTHTRAHPRAHTHKHTLGSLAGRPAVFARAGARRRDHPPRRHVREERGACLPPPPHPLFPAPLPLNLPC